MEKHAYTLLGDYPMKWGGRHRQPGETLDMTEREAEPYVLSGRLRMDSVSEPDPTPGEKPGKDPTPDPPPDAKPKPKPKAGGAKDSPQRQ